MRTDTTKLTVTFSNSANAPKNVGNNDLIQGTIFDPLYLAKKQILDLFTDDLEK
jgi:hypothetical protein